MSNKHFWGFTATKKCLLSFLFLASQHCETTCLSHSVKLGKSRRAAGLNYFIVIQVGLALTKERNRKEKRGSKRK